MSIHGLMVRACNEDAVYWGNPTADGYGGFTFDDPIEIKCRWEDRSEIMSTPRGEEFVSSSRIFVLQDLDEQGYLFRGTLDDLDSGYDGSDPKTAENAFVIKRFAKIPNINATGYVRSAYL